ncbi:MAP4K4 isoform 18, partial [Pan troglodytes]
QQRREREARRQQEREQRRREQEEKRRLEELERRRKEEEERRRAEEEKRRVEREQEYIRRQLEEEQRHLEVLQQQLLQEQAMLLECRWREMEEHRQAERLQRQLQQEQAYLLSLQHDHRRPHPQHSQQPPPPQQERSKPSFHAPEPKAHYEPADRAREVQWSHLASLKNNVSPVSRSHSFSDPSPPKFAHHHLRSQDPCPPSRSEVLSQSSDSKSEAPDPTQKAWSRSDSDEVPPRVPVRTTSRSPVLSRRDSPLQGSGQ